MTIRLKDARVERFAVDGHFTIARGAKTHVDVVVAEVTDGTYIGRGEGTPIYYEGETAELCAESIWMRGRQNRLLSREDLLRSMAEGAARNALDAALWDLESQATGKPIWALADLPAPTPLTTAITISLDEPHAMQDAAARAAARGFTLMKLKLTGEDDRARVAAVRAGAPTARLIVDANESWGDLDIAAEAHALAALGVEMIEQPVPAGDEDLLDGVVCPVPLCADESCHTRDDLDRLSGFQAVNIKLDKAGGLTEAIALAHAARARGMDLMVGCMLSTSLGIAPAFALAPLARWVDLDGPELLKHDRTDLREGAFAFRDGMILPR